MNKKAIVLTVATLFLLSLVLSPTAFATSWGFTYEGMNLTVYAPTQAYPGDTITIRVRVEALEDLQSVYVTVWIYGTKSQGYATWSTSISVLNGVDLSSGVVRDENFNKLIPSDVDSGQLYSRTYARWKTYEGWITGWVDRSYDGSFFLTYLKNKAYDDLLTAYNNLLSQYNQKVAQYNDLVDKYNTLKSDYDTMKTQRDYWKTEYDSVKSAKDSLQTSYNNLQSKYNSLNSTYTSLLADYNNLKSKTGVVEPATTTTLNYILALTTIVFLITTVFFATRKPKAKLTTKTAP
jgi:uncharacterized protein YdcH (DUF465 family)